MARGHRTPALITIPRNLWVGFRATSRIDLPHRRTHLPYGHQTESPFLFLSPSLSFPRFPVLMTRFPCPPSQITYRFSCSDGGSTILARAVGGSTSNGQAIVPTRHLFAAPVGRQHAARFRFGSTTTIDTMSLWARLAVSSARCSTPPSSTRGPLTRRLLFPDHLAYDLNPVVDLRREDGVCSWP